MKEKSAADVRRPRSKPRREDSRPKEQHQEIARSAAAARWARAKKTKTTKKGW